MRVIGILALPALMMLAACGNEPEPSTATNGKADGEILEGSISDAMLPLDTVTSQSPPMKVEPASGSTSGPEAAADEEQPEEAAPEAEPTPEEEPAE